MEKNNKDTQPPGNDVGNAYRSPIFFLNEYQHKIADGLISEIDDRVSDRTKWLLKLFQRGILGHRGRASRLPSKILLDYTSYLKDRSGKYSAIPTRLEFN